MVKPSSSLEGVMKLRFPRIIKLPVVMYKPVGGVFDTYSSCTQYTLVTTLLSQALEWHNSKIAASLRLIGGTIYPLGFLITVTAAPGISVCINKSPLLRYLLTKTSFYYAFLPDITR